MRWRRPPRASTTAWAFPHGFDRSAGTLSILPLQTQRFRVRPMVPHGLSRSAICAKIGHTHHSRASADHGRENRRARTDESTCRTSGTSPGGSRCSPASQAARRGAVRRWSICMAALVHRRPQHRQGPPRKPGGHGVVVVSLDWRTARRAPIRLAPGRHQLCDPLGQAARQASSRPGPTCRHLRPVERRPSAMLAAMRPNDPRYTAISLPAGSPALDATVQSPSFCRGR